MSKSVRDAALKAAVKLKKGELSLGEYQKYMLKIPEVKFKETPPKLPVIHEDK